MNRFCGFCLRELEPFNRGQLYFCGRCLKPWNDAPRTPDQARAFKEAWEQYAGEPNRAKLGWLAVDIVRLTKAAP